MLHGFKASSTMNVTEPLDLNGHINTNLMFKPKGSTCMYNFALEPVLFEKLHDIMLSHSVFRVTIFFQFTSTETALKFFLQYRHDFKDNLNYHKSYDVRQHVLTYSALLKLCTDELTDCKSKLPSWLLMLITFSLPYIKPAQKCTKRGIIHSLFNFLFGNQNKLADINSIKNNMAILEENQDIISIQIQKTFNLVNPTYAETNSNRPLLRSLQKDILQVNNTVHHLSKELKVLFQNRIFFLSG